MGNINSKGCPFCEKLELIGSQNQQLWFKDNMFAFHDRSKSSAKQHVLICTRQHVKNAYYLTNPNQMQEMKAFGQDILTKLCHQRGQFNPRFRFGFHLPPYNSVHHIHLHCFVLPFTNCVIDKFHFGFMLHSIEETQQKWYKKNCK